MFLDRPPVNALTPDVLQAIGAAFGSFAGDRDVRVAVLASAVERAFCAGADIKASLAATGDDPPPTDPGARGRDALWSLYDCAVPVIAAVNGPALGGGLALVSCCDIIVASERAVFGLPEIDVGLLGGGSHLQRMIGPHRMRHAFFTGRRIPAADMLAWGRSPCSCPTPTSTPRSTPSRPTSRARARPPSASPRRRSTAWSTSR